MINTKIQAAYLHESMDSVLSRHVVPEALAKQLQCVINVDLIPQWENLFGTCHFLL
jgi:hypothetical protein